MHVETVTRFVFAFLPLPGPVSCQVVWVNFIVTLVFFESLHFLLTTDYHGVDTNQNIIQSDVDWCFLLL